MHTKRKMLWFRWTYFFVTAAYVVLTLVVFICMLAHKWGMNYQDVDGTGGWLELMIIGIIGFILIFLFALVQDLFIVNSIRQNDSAIFDGLCYRERDRLCNKLALWTTAIIGIIFLGLGLWFFIGAYLPTLDFFKYTAIPDWGNWGNPKDYGISLAGLGYWGNEIYLMVIMISLLVVIDCAAILIYMAMFRRDYLIGKIKRK